VVEGVRVRAAPAKPDEIKVWSSSLFSVGEGSESIYVVLVMNSLARAVLSRPT
jgi:hypothetical protein